MEMNPTTTNPVHQVNRDMAVAAAQDKIEDHTRQRDAHLDALSFFATSGEYDSPFIRGHMLAYRLHDEAITRWVTLMEDPEITLGRLERGLPMADLAWEATMQVAADEEGEG